MQIVFWLFLGLVLFIYFIFPIVIFIIAKLMGKEPEKMAITPFVSLIIPMYNEERMVKEKIENIISLDYPKTRLEVIFALDGCTDRTKNILKEYNNKQIKILNYKDRVGKIAILNKAVQKAKGEIIVSSDANSMFEMDALKTLVSNFADAKVGCVCGKLIYKDANLTSMGKGENLYWRYEDFIKRQESNLGKLLITNGSIQAVRKSLYPYPDPEIADDFSIPLLIQADGYKIIYEPGAIVSEAATQSPDEGFNQKARIISQGIKGVIRLRKDLLRLGFLGLFELLFHKALRWGVPVYLIIIFLSNLILIGKPFYASLFMLQLVFYLFAFVGFILRHNGRIKIFYIPFYFCLVNSTSLAALFRYLKGANTQIWDKAHTTRI